MNGYTIVQDFVNNHNGDLKKFFLALLKEMEQLFRVFKNTIMILQWVCLELMSFGQFSAFVEFYSERTNDSETRRLASLLNLLEH